MYFKKQSRAQYIHSPKIIVLFRPSPSFRRRPPIFQNRTSRHRTAPLDHLVPALSSIRYRCPSLIPSQDVRQRIRHRVHRRRCLRHHPHGGRSDQEGRVSFCNKSRAAAIYFVPSFIWTVPPVLCRGSNLFGTMTHKCWTDHDSGHRRADVIMAILENQCALVLISRSRTQGKMMRFVSEEKFK